MTVRQKVMQRLPGIPHRERQIARPPLKVLTRRRTKKQRMRVTEQAPAMMLRRDQMVQRTDNHLPPQQALEGSVEALHGRVWKLKEGPGELWRTKLADLTSLFRGEGGHP